jgi:multidrug efflux system membrane fusion protein
VFVMTKGFSPAMAPVAALLLAACSGGGEEKGGPGGPGAMKRPPQLVAAQTAATADFAPTLVALGTVTPRQSVAVRPRADGEIIGIDFREGDMVRAGQVLFRLDARTAVANVKQAEAQLKGAIAAERRATLDYERAEALVGKGFISTAVRDERRALAYSARSDIETARAQLDAARVALSFLTITAPISGRTGELGFRLGANVRAGEATPLVTINQLSPIHVRFLVPAGSVQQARALLAAGGGNVVAKMQGTGEVLANGRLVFLDNNVDPGNGGVAARAEFANPGEALWPGAIVDVELPLGQPRPYVALPEGAVQTGRDAPFVWAVTGGTGGGRAGPGGKPGSKVQMRNVEIAGRLGGTVYIASGVKPGEQVVVDALARLRDGDAVRLKPAGKPADRPQLAGKPGASAAVGSAG